MLVGSRLEFVVASPAAVEVLGSVMIGVFFLTLRRQVGC